MSEINYVEFKTEPYILPAVVVIISIVILIHYFYTRIYGKKHVNNKDKHYSDIRSWYYGTYANPLDVQNLVENKIAQMKEATLKEIKDISIKIAVDSVVPNQDMPPPFTMFDCWPYESIIIVFRLDNFFFAFLSSMRSAL